MKVGVLGRETTPFGVVYMNELAVRQNAWIDHRFQNTRSAAKYGPGAMFCTVAVRGTVFDPERRTKLGRREQSQRGGRETVPRTHVCDGPQLVEARS